MQRFKNLSAFKGVLDRLAFFGVRVAGHHATMNRVLCRGNFAVLGDGIHFKHGRDVGFLPDEVPKLRRMKKPQRW
jgi:hypothetical protein